MATRLSLTHQKLKTENLVNNIERDIFNKKEVILNILNLYVEYD
jgi:hypothetical protein